MRLFKTNLRIVARDADIDLRGLCSQIEVHQQREVGFGDSATAEHFNFLEVGQTLQDVKVNVVETSIEQGSISVLTLNLRQRVTTIRQQFAFGTKCLGDKLFPRATIKREAKRQRIQKQPDHAITVGCFRPAVRNQTGDYVVFAANHTQNPEVCGKQHALERHAGPAC